MLIVLEKGKGYGGPWVLFLQFCCEPKTSLKNKVQLKKTCCLKVNCTLL